MDQIPIKDIPHEKQQPIIRLVDNLLQLNTELTELNENTSKKTKIIEEINKNEQEIDLLIYGLYGLNETEIALIKGSLK